MAGKLKPTQLLYYGQTSHSQAYLPVRVDQTQAGTVSSWNSERRSPCIGHGIFLQWMKGHKMANSPSQKETSDHRVEKTSTETAGESAAPTRLGRTATHAL